MSICFIWSSYCVGVSDPSNPFDCCCNHWIDNENENNNMSSVKNVTLTIYQGQRDRQDNKSLGHFVRDGNPLPWSKPFLFSEHLYFHYNVCKSAQKLRVGDGRVQLRISRSLLILTVITEWVSEWVATMWEGGKVLTTISATIKQ